jgi:hypothetical protein
MAVRPLCVGLGLQARGPSRLGAMPQSSYALARVTGTASLDATTERAIR